MTYLQKIPSGKRLLVPLPPDTPNPGCAICGGARVTVQIDTAATTLAQFIDKVGSGTPHSFPKEKSLNQ
jgi:hypothetical protein